MLLLSVSAVVSLRVVVKDVVGLAVVVRAAVVAGNVVANSDMVALMTAEDVDGSPETEVVEDESVGFGVVVEVAAAVLIDVRATYSCIVVPAVNVVVVGSAETVMLEEVAGSWVVLKVVDVTMEEGESSWVLVWDDVVDDMAA